LIKALTAEDRREKKSMKISPFSPEGEKVRMRGPGDFRFWGWVGFSSMSSNKVVVVTSVALCVLSG